MIASLIHLPGAAMVKRGINDLECNRISAHALLVLCAITRLRTLGLRVPKDEKLCDQAELKLYALLQKSHSKDAYRRYNSMRRELCSFIRALEHQSRSDAL
ncbi:MAG: hypothetical protein IPJ88_18370 [Myxococcales bacterium]|nr:MAG: hypothetical protein IPJ88_18370 [Myxococcales bacterium]